MSELEELRAEKDAVFREDAASSPLTTEQRAEFTGLRYYPEAPELAFELQPEPFEEQQVMDLETSMGDTQRYLRWARASFEVDGVPAALTVFRELSGGGLFVPFQDANAGGETYGAGRYLEPEELGDGRIRLDFNYAYNPYCAYNDAWSCPLPPAENRLGVAIRAGEMTFEEGH